MASDSATDGYQSDALVVLFADIAGSTQIYEEFGDVIARDATSACIKLIIDIAKKYSGELIKTIGDEAMITFADPTNAVVASNEMQIGVQQASEAGKFATGALRIKVGFHYGAAIASKADVHGEATLVATQLANMAKADQILTSEATLSEVAPALRVGSRPVEKILVDGVRGDVDVFEMIWEVSEMTQMADIRPVRDVVKHERLVLTFNDNSFIVDAQHPVLSLGRVAGNDVVVETDLTSRQHAEIELTRGRFQLSDNSSNGTCVVAESGARQTLRRDKMMLSGSGTFCLGGPPEDNPNGIVAFRCE